MHQLLAEILRYAELEHVQGVVDVQQLKELVVPCNGGEHLDYYAVDSGYVVRRVGVADVLIQTMVAVGKDVRRRFVMQRVVEDPHREARRNEIRFAESISADIVLVDGPLTPYVNTARVIAVSKDPRLVRYGPRIPEKDKREAFMKLVKAVGERELAGLLLSASAPGSYLLPVDLGGLYGTFFKSDWVVYVEYPKHLDAGRLCALFRRYPVRLRLAHHLAKVNREYLETVGAILSGVLRTPLRPRELL